MYKTHQLRTTFASWDVEKVHAVVARGTFRSQNVPPIYDAIYGCYPQMVAIIFYGGDI